MGFKEVMVNLVEKVKERREQVKEQEANIRPKPDDITTEK